MITSTAYVTIERDGHLELPIRLHERPSRWKTATFLSALLPAFLLVSVPPVIVAGYFLTRNSDVVANLSASPILIGECLFALLLSAALIWVLATHVIPRTFRSRVITIGSKSVTVRQKGLFGRREWTEPLSQFQGVTREVTPTFGGWQQRLVLQHPRVERNIALWAGSTIPDHLEENFAALCSRG